MAFIKCPECGKEVSDQADVCIHCGYPIQKNINEKKTAELEKEYYRLLRLERKENINDWLSLCDKDYAPANIIVGEYYQSREEWKRAIDFYKKAILSKDKLSEADYDLSLFATSTCYMNLKDNENALDYALKGSSGDCHYRVALLYWYKKECEKSIEESIKALKIGFSYKAFNNARVYLNLSNNYHHIGDKFRGCCYAFLSQKFSKELGVKEAAAKAYDAYLKAIGREWKGKIENIDTWQQVDGLAKEYQSKDAGYRSKGSGVPHCPTCGSSKVSKIDGLDRWLSVGLFGPASGKFGKSFKCKKCGYTW